MSVISEVMDKIKKQDPDQVEFHQAAEEVLSSLEPTTKKHPEFVKAKIYETDRRAGQGVHLPRSLDRRQGRGPGQQRIQGSVQ